MLKTISSSELRAQIKRILNEVGYGQSQYVVERFGEPTAAIVSVEDLRLLQALKRRRARSSLRELLAGVRSRSRDLPRQELDALIEEARAEFYDLQHQASDA
jgi:prevent-host-death family protein